MFDQNLPTTKQGARRTLAAAMISIGRAEDPLAEFKAREEAIGTALDALGRDFSARRFLDSCGFADEGVGAAEEAPELPAAAVQELRAVLTSDFGVAEPALLAIDEVSGSALEGYDVAFSVAGETRQVFAIEHQGRWVFAPGPIGSEDLDAVTDASRRHFDQFIAMGLHLRGVSCDEIEALRGQIRPLRTLWPDERDPRDACDTSPLVFVMHNPVGCNRGLFCSYDPLSERADPYDTDDPA